MKAIFKNIGPVNKAELELKDLTIIAGANNTGKTYLAYTLYGFLKLAKKPLFQRRIVKDLPFDSDKAVQEILDSGNTRFSVNDFDNMAKKLVKNILRISADIISEIFSSPVDDFAGAEFSLYSDSFSQDRREQTIIAKTGRDGEFHISASFEKGILSFNLTNYESSA